MVALSGLGWRLAPSLVKLYREVEAIDPNRPTASDGSIGDADHASRDSDHNPHVRINGTYYVTALDLTDGGKIFDPDVFLEQLRMRRDFRVKYAICDGRFFSSYSTSTRRAWEWAKYTGPNGHFLHGHLSILPTEAVVMSTAIWIPKRQPIVLPPRETAMAAAKLHKKAGETKVYICDGITKRHVKNKTERDWLLRNGYAVLAPGFKYYSGGEYDKVLDASALVS